MKSIFFVSILTLTFISCKTSSHTPCDAYSINNNVEDSIVDKDNFTIVDPLTKKV